MEKGQCSISGDLALAKRICEELTRGNNSVLHEIAHLDPVFRKLAAWKTYDEVDPEDAVNDFWEKKIILGRAVCNYNGRNDATLETFLRGVLHNFLLDVNRQAKSARANKKHVPLDVCGDLSVEFLGENIPNVADASDEEENGDRENEGQDGSVEEADRAASNQITTSQYYSHFMTPVKNWYELHEENNFEKLIDDAKKIMAKTWPEEEKIISLRMEGLTFQEIAQRLSDENAGVEDLKRVENRIKKQFGRQDSGTGALRKFNIILERLLVERGVSLSFVNDQAILFDPEVASDQQELFSSLKQEAFMRLERLDKPAALSTKADLGSISFAEFALRFGTHEGRPILANPAFKKFNACVQTVLGEQGLTLGIQRGTPFLKKVK